MPAYAAELAGGSESGPDLIDGEFPFHLCQAGHVELRVNPSATSLSLSELFGVMFSHARAEWGIRGCSGRCDGAIPADLAVFGGATLVAIRRRRRQAGFLNCTEQERKAEARTREEERQQKEYEAERTRKKKLHKARLAKFDSMLDKGPATFEAVTKLPARRGSSQDRIRAILDLSEPETPAKRWRCWQKRNSLTLQTNIPFEKRFCSEAQSSAAVRLTE